MRILRLILIVFLILPHGVVAQTEQYGSIMSGTGFFITPEYVVTNAHVVRGCNKVMIKGAVPARMAQVSARDDELDLALIYTDSPSSVTAPLSQNYGDPIPGDKVYIVGYPGENGARGIYAKVEAEIQGMSNWKDWFSFEFRVGKG